MIEHNKQVLDKLFENHPWAIPVVLIDFSNMLVVYFNSFRNLSVISGNSFIPTGAMYGLTNLVERIQKAYPHSLLLFCMDSGDGGRKTIFPNYKINRIVTEEKKTLFSYKDKIMSMMSIVPSVYFCKTKGMEADDVIATLAFTLKEMGREVIIHSRDYDFAQLAQYDIKIAQKLDNGQFEYLTDDFLLERYNVTTKYILHYRVLEGDDSDDIPIPVKNIKKAFKAKFVSFWRNHSYDEALKILHPNHPKEVLKFNTKESRDQVKINMQLMDLCKYRLADYQVPVDIFKGDSSSSVDYIKEYSLKQYHNFLNMHYPNYI